MCFGNDRIERRSHEQREHRADRHPGTSLVTSTPCTATSVPTALTWVYQTQAVAVATTTATGEGPACGGDAPSPPYVRQAK
jgi:hypothetical protein